MYLNSHVGSFAAAAAGAVGGMYNSESSAEGCEGAVSLLAKQVETTDMSVVMVVVGAT